MKARKLCCFAMFVRLVPRFFSVRDLIDFMATVSWLSKLKLVHVLALRLFPSR